MRTPLLVALINAFIFVGGAVASAQTSSPFRSFSVMEPTLCDEVRVHSTVDSPAGRYRVRRAVGIVTEETYQVSECTPLQPTFEMRQETPGSQFLECRVVQVSQALGCEPCTPSAIVFDRVLFARYTSTVRDARGRPIIDNRYAALSIGVRRVRLFVEEARFVLHDRSVSEPSMTILEAPIRR